MQHSVALICFGSYCGAFLSKSFSRFQITASALKSEPSWNFTPRRSLNTHLDWSSGETWYSSAR